MNTFEEYIKEQFKSEVYKALENVAFNYPDVSSELHKEAMEEAVEWFMTHFYDTKEDE